MTGAGIGFSRKNLGRVPPAGIFLLKRTQVKT